jgi:hypothetical protein
MQTVNTPKSWPFPNPHPTLGYEPRPSCSITPEAYRWVPHLETIRDARGRIWSAMALGNRAAAAAEIARIREACDSLQNALADD